MGGTGVAVAERLGQRVFGRVVHAAEPVEPQAAWLGAGSPGELAGDLGPLVGVLGQYSEPGGNEDHREPPSRRAGPPLSPAARARGQVPRAVTRSVRSRARWCLPAARAAGHSRPMSGALIVIDVQESFRQQPMWSAISEPGIVGKVGQLVAAARDRGDLVVWVLHAEPGTGTVFDPDGGHVRLMDGLVPADGEPVITKTSHNAFTTTNLQQLLTTRAISDLTVCGIRTEQCCETTTRVAADLGFTVTFVTDATATSPIPHRDAPPGRSVAEIIADARTLPVADIIARTEYQHAQAVRPPRRRRDGSQRLRGSRRARPGRAAGRPAVHHPPCRPGRAGPPLPAGKGGARRPVRGRRPRGHFGGHR